MVKKPKKKLMRLPKQQPRRPLTPLPLPPMPPLHLPLPLLQHLHLHPSPPQSFLRHQLSRHLKFLSQSRPQPRPQQSQQRPLPPLKSQSAAAAATAPLALLPQIPRAQTPIEQVNRLRERDDERAHDSNIRPAMVASPASNGLEK